MALVPVAVQLPGFVACVYTLPHSLTLTIQCSLSQSKQSGSPHWPPTAQGRVPSLHVAKQFFAQKPCSCAVYQGTSVACSAPYQTICFLEALDDAKKKHSFAAVTVTTSVLPLSKELLGKC